jgi:hypothetical protein
MYRLRRPRRARISTLSSDRTTRDNAANYSAYQTFQSGEYLAVHVGNLPHPVLLANPRRRVSSFSAPCSRRALACFPDA